MTRSEKIIESLSSLYEERKKDPCWNGYHQEGFKKGKSGKMVPNCVKDT